MKKPNAKQLIDEFIAIQRNMYYKDHTGFRRSIDVHKSKKQYTRKDNKQIINDEIQ